MHRHDGLNGSQNPISGDPCQHLTCVSRIFIHISYMTVATWDHSVLGDGSP